MTCEARTMYVMARTCLRATRDGTNGDNLLQKKQLMVIVKMNAFSDCI